MPEQSRAATQAASAAQEKDEPTKSHTSSAASRITSSCTSSCYRTSTRFSIRDSCRAKDAANVAVQRQQTPQETIRKFLKYELARHHLHAYFATKLIGPLIVNTIPLSRRTECDVAISNVVEGAYGLPLT